MATSASLISLPDEILLPIALAIDKFDQSNTQLRYLALTHRRFTGIVRRTLVWNVLVPRHGASAYVALLQRHPEWAMRVEQLEVHEFGPCLQDTS